MRVPLSWLAEWIPLEVPPETLADRLTLGGVEVEAVERTGPDVAGLVVGRVVECGAHPGADRLRLARVDVGAGEPLSIVCGAPNVAAGQLVAVAPHGARLPDGRRIKRSRIRGEVSEGMICSEIELGLGADADGILVLETGAPPGAPLSDAIGGDVVLEISLTPNRGDCASLLGIAREVRAHFGGTVTLPASAPSEGARPAAGDLSVDVLDKNGCHHFAARVVHGVRVGPSPAWLARKVDAFGIRPISNVVDVTNLVMAELGKPVHAYDLAALRGAAIRVRRAEPGEKLRTLDGQDRVLEPGDVVIADAERAIGLGGVMGGADTEVHAGTTSVVIESALFRPARIRRTARRLGLSSEASYRFERGVDPETVALAADRAARLIAELTGGEVAAGIVESRGDPPPRTQEILLDPARVNRLLGTELDPPAVRELLARVEIESIPEGPSRLCCRVPSYRLDLHRPEDLIEEVGRIHGYDRIPATLPEGPVRPVRVPTFRPLTERLRDSFSACGLIECMMLPFQRAGDLERLSVGGDDARRKSVQVLNPVVENEAALATTLLPGLLRAAGRCLRHRVERVRVFELGHGFFRGPEGELPEERSLAAALVTRGPRIDWWEPAEAVPLFFELKGVAERVLGELGLAPAFEADAAQPYLHPGAAAAVRAAGGPVGWLGELHPEVAARFEIDSPCAVLELDVDALLATEPDTPSYREVSQQPSVQRDLAVLLDRDVQAGDVLAAIRESAGPELVGLRVFDRYEGAGIPAGKVSLAFRLTFQRRDRTLVEAEVTRSVDRVVAMLAERFRGELR